VRAEIDKLVGKEVYHGQNAQHEPHPRGLSAPAPCLAIEPSPPHGSYFHRLAPLP
jgi:hypothetical protein